MTLPIREVDFQRRVTELAKLLGWRTYHHRPARVGNRIVTALEGTPGFPDLILLRPPVLIVAELKVGSNKPSPEQREWIDQLATVPGVTACLWRPEDWESIVVMLSGRRAAA